MSCSKWIERISHMVDGSLAGDDLKRLESHLAECRVCRAELALQKSIVRALSAEPALGLPADFPQRVAAKALAAQERARRTRLWLPLVPPLAAATAAAALFFLGIDLAAQSPPVFEQAAGAVLKPPAWTAEVIFRLIRGAAGLESHLAPLLGWVSRPEAGLAVAVAVGAVPALWSLRRVLVYLK